MLFLLLFILFFKNVLQIFLFRGNPGKLRKNLTLRFLKSFLEKNALPGYPRKQSKMCVIYLKNRHFCVIPAKIEHKKVNFFDFFSKNFLKIEKISIFFQKILNPRKILNKQNKFSE